MRNQPPGPADSYSAVSSGTFHYSLTSLLQLRQSGSLVSVPFPCILCPPPFHSLMVGRGIFLLLRFGVGHVICFSQWDISGFNTNTGLRCTSIIEMTFCALHPAKNVPQEVSGPKRMTDTRSNPVWSLEPNLDQPNTSHLTDAWMGNVW